MPLSGQAAEAATRERESRPHRQALQRSPAENYHPRRRPRPPLCDAGRRPFGQGSSQGKKCPPAYRPRARHPQRWKPVPQSPPNCGAMRRGPASAPPPPAASPGARPALGHRDWARLPRRGEHALLASTQGRSDRQCTASVPRQPPQSAGLLEENNSNMGSLYVREDNVKALCQRAVSLPFGQMTATINADFDGTREASPQLIQGRSSRACDHIAPFAIRS